LPPMLTAMALLGVHKFIGVVFWVSSPGEN